MIQPVLDPDADFEAWLQGQAKRPSFTDLVRSCSLSCYAGDGTCAWCGAELEGRRTVWCSDYCHDDARANHWWGAASALAKERDDHECQECGAPDEAGTDAAGSIRHRSTLEAHHIQPVPPGDYRYSCAHHQDNLVTLCRRCHGAKRRKRPISGRKLRRRLDALDGGAIPPDLYPDEWLERAVELAEERAKSGRLGDAGCAKWRLLRRAGVGVVSRCRSCDADAEIIWAVTTNGKRMPLDAKPEKRVVLDREQGWGGNAEPVAKVVDTYVSHFSSCPNADQHRKAGTS